MTQHKDGTCMDCGRESIYSKVDIIKILKGAGIEVAHDSIKSKDVDKAKKLLVEASLKKAKADYAKGLPEPKPGDLHIPTNTAFHGKNNSFDLETSDIKLYELKEGGFMFKVPSKYTEKIKEIEKSSDKIYIQYNGKKWNPLIVYDFHNYTFIILKK